MGRTNCPGFSFSLPTINQAFLPTLCPPHEKPKKYWHCVSWGFEVLFLPCSRSNLELGMTVASFVGERKYSLNLASEEDVAWKQECLAFFLKELKKLRI